MEKIRVSAVKYINSYPFMIGLRSSQIAGMIDLGVCHPSECADRLIEGKTDLGLIPVAMIAGMKEYHLVSDYCLSTNGEVRTVLLVSNTPFGRSVPYISIIVQGARLHSAGFLQPKPGSVNTVGSRHRRNSISPA